jgi:hypothetical protein
MQFKEIFAPEVYRVNVEHTDTLFGHDVWGFNVKADDNYTDQ